MRISDWSSDVCSSDLGDDALVALLPHQLAVNAGRLHLAALAIDVRQHLDVEEAVVQRRHQGVGAMVPEAAEIGVAARRIDHDEMTVGEIVEGVLQAPRLVRSEEHTSELQSLMRISY